MFDNYNIEIKFLTFDEYLHETGMSLEQVIKEHITTAEHYVCATIKDKGGTMFRCFKRIDTNESDAVKDAIDTIFMFYY